jgi:type IV secretory pathway ATPase VirB11/archaellum biosynthesis ATPase
MYEKKKKKKKTEQTEKLYTKNQLQDILVNQTNMQNNWVYKANHWLGQSRSFYFKKKFKSKKIWTIYRATASLHALFVYMIWFQAYDTCFL